MKLSMYQASVPVFQRGLANLGHVLDKGLTDAGLRKIDPQVLLQARLAPDMLPLIRQVQIATDHAKGGPSRLAGLTAPKFEDNETTFEQLQERIQKIRAFLATLQPAQLDGSEERDIALKAGPHDLQFKGLEYLLGFATPNFYFHVSMAYAILRHNGVPIGKVDFIYGKAGLGQ